MVSAKNRSDSSRLEILQRRKQLRQLLLENLERRDLMASDAAGPVFAPGTPQAYIDHWINALSDNSGGNGSGSPINLQGTRWVNPTGGVSPNRGDPSVVTWSIVPDGTPVPDINQSNPVASNLIAFMDGIYGTAPGPLSDRPWFPIFERAYQRWSESSGLTFVYEPNDDGVASGGTNRGVLGVRGDVRVTGRNIDGNFGILAFNYYPNGSGNSGFDGDMVIDTNDNFYRQFSDGAGGENRGLFNVLMHEAGHGIGLGHVIPINETKLMEPSISFNFLGAQLDDIIGAQTLYGDDDENNDTQGAATNLGTLTNGLRNFNGRSIDNNNDTDLYSFRVNSSGKISIAVTPTGVTYDVGPQGGNSSPTDSLRYKDLSFVLEAQGGTVLATASGAGIGEKEEVVDFDLPSGGVYRIRINGTGSLNTQLYDMSVRLSGLTNPSTADQNPPRLLSVAANSGEIFGINRVNVLAESPRELIFRFDGSQRLDANTLSGIKISRSNGDGMFADGDDVVLQPGWIGFGDTERIVIARFSNPLPDDVYKIEILGVDLPSEGRTGIRNTDGELLRPRKSGTDRDVFFMNLELGAQIMAIVPQPVSRSATGTLQQARDRIEVYFNNDPLHATPVTTGTGTNPSVVDPAFYKLIFTNDSVNPNDDRVFAPSTISYDPTLNRAVLTFASPIDQLVGTNGTFRLRVGSNESVASIASPRIPLDLDLSAVDVGDTLNASTDLGSLAGGFSAVISQEVRMPGNAVLPDYPGSNFDPGHRDIQDESHLDAGPDANPDISVLTYSFLLNQSYGVDTVGRPLFTSISSDQIARTREIMEFLSAQWGIDFIETAGFGDLNVVVGDMAPLQQTSGPGGVIGVAGQGLAIMDQAEAWDNTFGYGAGIPGTSSFFITAMHEIMHLLGLGHAYEQPNGTIMGGNERATDPSSIGEWFFPGDVDTIHGQHIFRPDNKDVDIYRFQVPAGEKGELTLETIAERLDDSSLVDTHLTLMRKTATGYEIVALNDNYFSDDSYLKTTLDGGDLGNEYFIAVTSRGNGDFNPKVVGTGSGGTSAGAYKLRMDFKPSTASSIVDTTGTALDGDGDGLPGGNFDFWFRAAAPVGIAASGQPKTIFVDKQYTGPISIGSLAQPFKTINAATAAAREGDLIRVVGTRGVDGNIDTLADNPAYEIGDGGAGLGTLRDGLSLDVPKGVTMMLEAGAVLKFGSSAVVVGSLDASVDRSLSSLQVLGIPGRPVYFTSYFDQSMGIDTNPLTTTPRPGEWGGIDFRSDVDRSQGRLDREREGIFMNYVAFADMRFGGGQVGSGSQARVVNPINMSSSRPTLLNNTVRLSSDAGFSADPNSFEETTFAEPRYHVTGDFVTDYNRIGPVIRGNQFENNSINGIKIRIDTLAGQQLKPLTVSGRINDTDITYFLGENLIIEGTAGGPVLETQRPNATLVQVTPTTGGSLPVGSVFNYVLTYVDIDGGESLASLPTTNVTVGAGRAVQFNNLPAATGDFVGRRLWRSQPGGAGPYVMVAELNRDSTTTRDVGITIGGQLDTSVTSKLRARQDASLVIDPGVVFKALGSRIEVGIGATLIAEGTGSKPIVFTSRLDDRFGAGGTFDTNNDGTATAPSPGDWSGIHARHLSTLSVESALLSYGGGTSSIPGGFASFNTLEVHQATARVVNSTFIDNDSGRSTPSTSNRDSRGPNDDAVIFVVGSQPILVDNVIRNARAVNTAAISIDANSLKAVSVSDYGRSTGLNNRVDVGLGNMGPLVQRNKLADNSINGMRVRGATLTTESVWDDTDIVHVLQNVVSVPDFHTYGGLRLQSKVNESLVVKLQGNAGFTASGRPLDIPNRIGGSLQIIGSPGFPVVLTSLSDDTIGAGFDPFGRSQVDTDGSGDTQGTPGDWRSVRFDAYSNDRNVETTFELEADKIADQQVNDLPDRAQEIGALSPTLSGGDENLRLGFTIHGSIAAPSDLDVYRFTGTAGTMVWFDVDRSGGALDSVVELIDANGNIIVLSDNSMQESVNQTVFSDSSLIPNGRALPMDSSFFAYRNTLENNAQIDFQSISTLDAGFRAVLPGVAGSQNPYYVRVRSSNLGPGDSTSRLTNPANLREGITVGPYRLQLRLQQTDEIGGSTVRFADIRFAQRGIELIGLPGHSPLLGESAENAGPSGAINEGAGGATNIGNIGNSDRAALSVAGNLASRTDVDWFRFTIQRDSIQQPGNVHMGTILDLDYADGLGRADTTLWVFQETPAGIRLVMIGTDSDIADDQAAPLQGSDTDDLSRGSFGNRDPFIGSQELPDGTYFVAVTNTSLAFAQMDQYTTAATTNPNFRIEPANGVIRLSHDRFNARDAETGIVPETALQVAFNGTAAGFDRNRVPFTLADVTLFSASGRNLHYANAMTGAREMSVGQGTTPADFGATIVDIAVAPNGAARGIVPPQGGITDANSGVLLNIDIRGDGTNTQTGGSGITTHTVAGNGIVVQEVGVQFNALTFADYASGEVALFAVGQRGAQVYNEFLGIDANGNFISQPRQTFNLVYRLDPTTGAAITAAPGVRTGNFVATGAGTQIREYGEFPTTATVTGLAEIGDAGLTSHELYGVTNTGELWVMGISSSISDPHTAASFVNFVVDENGNPINFTSLAAGPRNIVRNDAGDTFGDVLFGLATNGRLYAFDTNGNNLPVFPRGAISVQMNTGLTGIDFSSMDSNLWHITSTRGADAGHGQPNSFDGSRGAATQGGNSLYFGYEANGMRGIWSGAYNMPEFYNTYNLPGNPSGAIESNPLDLRGYTADDQPMLYFNYHLDTEKVNTPNTDTTFMRDAFRVYGALPDGTWILLATNNAADDNSDTNGNNEVEPSITNYVDSFGKAYKAQKLFDINESGAPNNWRQARISLAPFAGQRDVRLRFEFSAEGDSQEGVANLGGMIITAISPAHLADGDTFAVEDPATGIETVFEFDLGLVLNVPSGASAVDGAVLTVEGTDFTFVSTATGAPNEIVFNATMTPTQLAVVVRQALENAGFVVATNTKAPNVLNVIGGVTPTGVHATVGLGSGIIIGTPGVSLGRVPVNINQEFPLNAFGNPDEALATLGVRDAIRTALALGLNEPGQETNIDPWYAYGNNVRLYGFNINSLGKLGGLAGRRPGDAFENETNLTSRSGAARNNAFGGVFVDDIIIGFAERGEMVHDPVIGTFDSFQDNTILNAGGLSFQAQPTPIAPIFTGTYQLEVRTAADYGITASATRLILNNPFNPGRSIDTNDRLAKQTAIEVMEASGIVDGTVFTISDGYNTATFEFDVVTAGDDAAVGVATGNIPVLIDPSFTIDQVASALASAINSPEAQAILKITAETSGKQPTQTFDGFPHRSSLVYLHGNAASDVLGGPVADANGNFMLAPSLRWIRSGLDTAFGEDLGDANRMRDQGQVIVSSTFVRSSSDVGILVDAGNRSRVDLAPDVGLRPYPGSARNLITLNNSQLAPGVVLVNNVVAQNNGGGIVVSGDAQANNPPAASTIARLMNNTIVGSRAATGIRIEQGAVPNVLNNIITGFATGISVDPASSGTVLGANLFQANTTNATGTTTGSFAILLGPTEPLFANANNGRFYPAAGSKAIDSSLASLQERAALSQVKNAVSLPVSPMIAPNRDIGGLLRIDDPAVNTPAGQGQNVFIDRGAVDRTDFVGPKAVLINPLDNDSQNLDIDRSDTYVRLINGNLSFFSVLLEESQGTGPDPVTVTADAVILTENGRVLEPNVDYIFGYSANSREIRLTPMAGFWRRDSVYEITLNNAPRIRLNASRGDRVEDGDRVTLNLSSGAQVVLEYESGFILQVPQTLTLVVPAIGSGPNGITDGQRFRIRNGSLDAEFEFDTDGNVSSGARAIAIPPIASGTVIRDAILAALLQPSNTDLNLAPKAIGTNRIHLGSLSVHDANVASSILQLEGSPGGIEDGQRLVVTRSGQPPVTFEFNLQGNPNIGLDNIPITFLRTDTFEEIAAKMVPVLSPYFTGGFVPVNAIPGGFVQLGGKLGDLVNVTNSQLSLSGVPGVTPSFELTVPAAGGAAVADGARFSLSVGNVSVLFEFTKDLATSAGTRSIAIRDTDSAAVLATKIANAIQGAGLGISPVATANRIKLNEPHGTILDLLTSGMTVTGVPGGAVAVPFIPSFEFTAGMMAGQLTKSINSIGLGIKASVLGTGTVMVEGVQSIAGAATSAVTVIRDFAGNALQPNRATTLTQFTIIMPEVGVDYGDAPGSLHGTLQSDSGARHALLPEDEPLLALGSYADADADGIPDLAALGDDFDSSVTLSTFPMAVGTSGPAMLQMPTPSPALVGQSIVLTDPLLTVATFEFTNGGAATIPGAIPVDIAGAVTSSDLATILASVVKTALLAGRIEGFIPIAIGNVVSMGGTERNLVNIATAPAVQRLNRGRLELNVLSTVASYAEGQHLTITDGFGNQVTFELDDPTTTASIVAGRVPFGVTLSTATPNSIANALASAINGQIAAGRLVMPQVTVTGAQILWNADDEDGVRFNGLFNSESEPVPVVVTSTGSGMLDAWFDWNADGDFADAGEQMLASQPVRAGENVFLMQAPTGATPGFTYARFRLSTTGALLNTGVGIGGEVEDYVIEILDGAPPVAANDTYTVNEDQLLTVAVPGILGNDIDPDGTPLTVRDTDPFTPFVQPLVGTRHGLLQLQSDGSFTYQPDPDFFGVDTFVYSAFDGRLLSQTPATVTINVLPVNDAPTAVADEITIDEDVSFLLPGSTFWSNDVRGPDNERNQTLTLVGATLVSPRGNGESIAVVNGQLRYTPPAEYNNRLGGPVLARLTIRDGGEAGGDANPLESTNTLTININFINDAPVYTMPTVLVSPEDGGAISIPNFLTGILPGPALATDEVTIDNQVVSFQVRAMDPSLFAVQPQIVNNGDGTGRLTFQLAPNVNNLNRPNPADLRVEVIAIDDDVSAPPPNDNSSDPRIFTIDVAPLNDAPEFTIPNNRPAVQEDAGPQTIANFATDIRRGPSSADDEVGQSVTFIVTARDPSAFTLTGQPAISPTGVLTYELARDVNSRFKNLTVDVSLRDSGLNGNGNVNESAIQTFSIVASHVNDAPNFDLTSAQVTALEDNEAETNTSITSFPGFASNIVTGPLTALDEPINQTVSFNLISVSRPEMFTTLPAISPTGTLTFRTAKDQNGSAVVVVQLQDSEAGSPPPNVNVSQFKTFTINLTAVNDAPEFTIPTAINTVEDQGLVRIPNFATNMRPGPTTAADENSQTFQVFVAALDPSKFVVQPTIAADGTLQFRTAVDVNGELVVEVFLVDDGPSSPVPNVNRSVVKQFTINTAPINDAPLFTLPNRQLEVIEDREAFLNIPRSVFPGFATNIQMGPPTAVDEVTQTPTFLVNVSAPELFSELPAIDANGVLTFRTAANRNGRATITIRLQDSGPSFPAPNNNLSTEQTVTLTISAINDAPLFTIPSSVTVDEDQGVVSINNFATNVLRGPIGADDESTQEVSFVVEAVNPAFFEIQPSMLPDGTLSFKTARDVNRNSPNAEFGVRVYLVDNGASAPPPNNNRSVTQTFNVNVNPVNDPPAPDIHTTSAVEDTPSTIFSSSVLLGDQPGPIDEAGQSLVITQVERTSDRGGSIVPVFSGTTITSFVYTPGPNVVGVDVFRYVVTDNGSPARGATGTITVNIDGINDPPQFTAGPGEVISTEDAGAFSVAWARDILAGPPNAQDENTGPTRQTVSFQVTATPSSLFSQGPTIDPDGTLRFTPAPDANGSAVIVATAVDSGSGVAPNVNRSAPVTFTISINSVNDAPVFTAGGNVSVAEDAPAYSQPWATRIAPAAGLLNTPATALDEQTQIVDFIVTNNRPSLFAVAPTITSAGLLQFTPASNAFGVATVVVRARDNGSGEGLNQNLSAPQTFTLTISGANDPPEGTGDSFSTTEDALLSISAPGLLANDFDTDLPNDILRATSGSSTSLLGVPVVVNEDGSFRYDPRSVSAVQALVDGQTLVDRFTYQVADASNATSSVVTVTITISGANDAPNAIADSFPVVSGQSILLDVLDNDTDVDTPIDPRTIEIGAIPLNGTVRVLQTGRVEYRSNSGFEGSDSFTYRVRDSLGLLSNEATVTVTTNNPPTAVNDVATTFIGRAININVLRNDFDTDGTIDPTTVEIAVAPTNGTVAVQNDGTVIFTPTPGFSGTTSFQYAVADDEGVFSNVATVTVRVSSSIYQNPNNRLDVNADGFISPIDALIVINALNTTGPRPLPDDAFVPPPFLDVSGNRALEALDALLVINFLNLNGNGSSAEGEAGSASGEANDSMFVMAPAVDLHKHAEAIVERYVERQVVNKVGAELRRRAATVPAFMDYAQGRIAGMQSVDGDLDRYLESLAWQESEKQRKSELQDDVFGSLVDDLLE